MSLQALEPVRVTECPSSIYTLVVELGTEEAETQVEPLKVSQVDVVLQLPLVAERKSPLDWANSFDGAIKQLISRTRQI
jgi:hypothetical protein